ncbi:MAG: hypothetical protein ACXWDO_01045 [Bacteroidia bacterium]
MLLGFDKKKHPLFLKSVFGCFTIICLSVLILQRACKNTSDFDSITGNVVYYDKTYKSWPIRHFGKYRYLKIHSSPLVFEIFKGKDKTDFGPAYEKLDNLKIGDSISIYYDHIESDERDPLNRLVYFIDKGNEVIFLKDRKSDFIFGYGLLGFAVILMAILFYLKHTDKIL